MTRESLTAAAATADSLHGLLLALGLSPGGGNYESARRRLGSLGIETAHLERRSRGSIRASDDEIRHAVRDSRSFAQVLLKLGHSPGGRVQARLRGRVKSLGLDTSHFSGQGWRRGSNAAVSPALRLDLVLVEHRPTTTSHLKRRLLDSGLKQPVCEACGRRRWNRRPIPLELDHVNGRRDDNRLSNLRLLCPNCHAQTPTYRGRNIGVVARVSSASPGAGTVDGGALKASV